MCAPSRPGCSSLRKAEVAAGVRRGSGSLQVKRVCFDILRRERHGWGWGRGGCDSMMFVLSIALLRGIFSLTVCGAAILPGSCAPVWPADIKWLSPCLYFSVGSICSAESMQCKGEVISCVICDWLSYVTVW